MVLCAHTQYCWTVGCIESVAQEPCLLLALLSQITEECPARVLWSLASYIKLWSRKKWVYHVKIIPIWGIILSSSGHSLYIFDETGEQNYFADSLNFIYKSDRIVLNLQSFMLRIILSEFCWSLHAFKLLLVMYGILSFLSSAY